ncbi:N-acetylmuramoyl-L-alanine amidase [Oscillatoria sp. CS-180]|uniref:N-acetylmuramoyl-L-alanine amidase n=1 Tax=Oscillatoria sp. CS-180 TaxID=3021720 RepID=UPI00232DE444|nr:N-acetylmuramoyl-L-alanine amidase [Oscillatoria sp. CS-180]MDB9526370.1 N-acetylmuramoyl-L-alanine amidase [Oscillatoria sp. CS-180]
MFTLPAEAAQLESWWFDARENQLVFTTDSAVRPRAQMVFNPTRIVIDLPGTTLGRPPTNQAIGGAIREVRSGQFDARTARLVIELSAGYTVNPRDIEVRGIRGNRWVVQLPQPEVSETAPTANAGNSVTGDFSNDATTFLSNVRATPDGFFVRTSGQIPTINLERRGDRGEERQIIIDLFNTSISPFLDAESLPRNRYSVSRWDITQDNQNLTTRIVMTLSPNSPDWEITPTNIGNQKGLVIIPPSGVSISSIPDRPQAVDPTIAVPPSSPPPAIPQPSQPPILPPSVNNGRILVAIDPGHGGRDPGAVGIGGLQEKNVVFPVSMRVAELLREAGVDVVMTRTSDLTLDLEPRVAIANNTNATIFLSIHANAISLSRPDVNGVETYYYSESGRQLASIIHANVQPASGLGNRGVKQARFYVLRNTAMPAALLELGFVTGAEDVVKLRDPAWQERMAQAITRGILQYLEPYRR